MSSSCNVVECSLWLLCDNRTSSMLMFPLPTPKSADSLMMWLPHTLEETLPIMVVGNTKEGCVWCFPVVGQASHLYGNVILIGPGVSGPSGLIDPNVRTITRAYSRDHSCFFFTKG